MYMQGGRQKVMQREREQRLMRMRSRDYARSMREVEDGGDIVHGPTDGGGGHKRPFLY